MKLLSFALTLFTLTICSTLSSQSFAQTADEQVEALTKANIPQIDEGYFLKDKLFVHVLRDGSYELFASFSYSPVNDIVAVTTKKSEYSSSLNLVLLHNNPKWGKRFDAENEEGSGLSGGSKPEIIAELSKLESIPLSKQLLDIGFKPVSASEKVWVGELNASPIIFIIENNSVVAIFKAMNKRYAPRLKGTTILGYFEKKNIVGNIDSYLHVRNAYMEFDVSLDYGGRASSAHFLKDVSEVDLKDLGSPVPEPKADTTGFVIGGLNPTSLVLGLTAINGSSIGDIIFRGQKVSGCSHGDPLISSADDLVQEMAQDNDKVQKLGLTHQALAKPLLYAQALVDAGLAYKFTFHGTEFEVSRTAMPMCGTLDSPFNDNYHTAIMFPRITNMKTHKYFEYSYLHPYLINQYGFYGSHLNRSYVNPEAILDVFDYLKAGN